MIQHHKAHLEIETKISPRIGRVVTILGGGEQSTMRHTRLTYGI